MGESKKASWRGKPYYTPNIGLIGPAVSAQPWAQSGAQNDRRCLIASSLKPTNRKSPGENQISTQAYIPKLGHRRLKRAEIQRASLRLWKPQNRHQ